MNVDSIFDAVGKASQYVIVQDQCQKKMIQIKSVQTERCGNCEHWMKSSCMPEKEKGQFKSISSISCKDFILSHASECMLKAFTGELKEIKLKIESFGG